jgi:hypothetical protein
MVAEAKCFIRTSHLLPDSQKQIMNLSAMASGASVTTTNVAAQSPWSCTQEMQEWARGISC